MMIRVCSLLGGRITQGYLKSMLNFQRFCGEKHITLNFHSFAGSDVYGGRNYCLLGEGELTADFSVVKPFNGEDYKKFIWIDSDSVFAPEDVMRLLSHDADIVSGLVKINPDTWGVGYFRKDGTGQYVTDATLADWEKEKKLPNGLCEVGICGGAFVAVRRGVYEAIQFPWYRTVLYGSDMLAEDQGFCVRAAHAGFKIYADPSVRVGHEKTMIFR